MKKLYIKTQGNAIVTASICPFDGAIEIDVDDSIGIENIDDYLFENNNLSKKEAEWLYDDRPIRLFVRNEMIESIALEFPEFMYFRKKIGIPVQQFDGGYYVYVKDFEGFAVNGNSMTNEQVVELLNSFNITIEYKS